MQSHSLGYWGQANYTRLLTTGLNIVRLARRLIKARPDNYFLDTNFKSVISGLATRPDAIQNIPGHEDTGGREYAASITTTKGRCRMQIKSQLTVFFILLSFSMAIAGPSMPDQIKTEFTQYPGSTVVHTMAAEGMVQAVLQCGKTTTETVFDYYKKEAARAGWDIAMELKNAEVSQLMLTKNNQSGMIAVTDEDGEISVVLSISQ